MILSASPSVIIVGVGRCTSSCLYVATAKRNTNLSVSLTIRNWLIEMDSTAPLKNGKCDITIEDFITSHECMISRLTKLS